MSPKTKLYPETAAGGFTGVDGTVQFYSRVRALLRPEHVLLDLGAGRGAGLLDDPVAFRRDLRTLRGHCKEVIGCDVDPIVLTNPGLDRAFLMNPDRKLDLPDASIDVIVSDYVMEHIENPSALIGEVSRILKPGGWFCARTPNYWGYIALASRLIPNRLHTKVVARVQFGRKGEDIFPTWYRLNTARDIRYHFPPTKWRHCSYTWEAEPAYFGRSEIAWRTAIMITKVLPKFFLSTRMVFIQKQF